MNKALSSLLLALLFFASSATNTRSASTGEMASKYLNVLLKKENGSLDKEKLFFAGITALSTLGPAALSSADPGKAVSQNPNFKALDAEDYDFVYEVAEELCESFKIAMPKIVVIPSPAPLVAAIGHSCIMISEGSLVHLNGKNLQLAVAKAIIQIKTMKNIKFQIASSSISYILNMLRIAKFGNNLSTTKEKTLYWLGAIASNVAISKCAAMIFKRMMTSYELEARTLISEMNQEA
jgi:hypothetical protein